MADRQASLSKMAAAALVVVLLVAGWQAGKSGLADAYSRPAASYMREQLVREGTLDTSSTDALVERFQFASDLNGAEPEILATLGFLQQLRFEQQIDALEVDALAQIAESAGASFQRAARLRPTWPYYWANIAAEQYKLGRYATPEFSRAIAHAAVFGPWKDDTQLLVAELGALAWPYLDEPAKNAVLGNLSRALERQRDTIMSSESVRSAASTQCDFFLAAQSAPGRYPDMPGHISHNASNLRRLGEYCEAEQQFMDEIG